MALLDRALTPWATAIGQAMTLWRAERVDKDAGHIEVTVVIPLQADSTCGDWGRVRIS